MNIRELQQRLEAEGCNPHLYAVGSRGTASDAFCLTSNGTQWQVFYTERGQDQSPIFASSSEEAACEFFFKYITGMRHNHLVGFFRSEAAAQALLERLAQLGLASSHDKIPYGGPADPRYRVFVIGKAIFAARAALGDVPLRD